jgi:N-acetylmuramic acid 6-phosphate etherase/N-acetylglucosamine-6-phosphate deacetylase
VSKAAKSADLGALDTEAVRPEFAELDILDVPDLVALMATESTRASRAVMAAVPEIAEVVTAVARRLAEGGRLIYLGAGTAGRLGVLDAAEAGPTFDVPSGLVLAVLAGGKDAIVRPLEGAEDDAEAGAVELRALGCSPRDAVIGVSASGQTPFVTGAILHARTVGALTVGIVCNRDSAIARASQLAVELLVGGEVIAGSTRLNAGTAQKITLNIISTGVMIQLGKTYGNLMVDVRPTNDKLRDRATRIVAAVANTSPERARQALEASGWRTKPACLVAASTMGPEEAVELLEANGGRLRAALDSAHLLGRETPAAAPNRSGRQRRLGVGAFLQHGRLLPGDVAVGDGCVMAVGLSPASDRIAVPGLVDLQVNGYGGIDALSASVDELAMAGTALARDGVLAYQPTLISNEIAGTKLAAARIAELAKRQSAGARILGIHLEGPFLSPMRAGTHPIERLAKADVDLLSSLLDAGPVTMVTIAPELPGALELIKECRRRGVVVSFGHSDANADEARRGFEGGGRAVTHIFNAMRPLAAREPGLAGAALADPRVTLQVIADGVHVADDMLRLVLTAGRGRWNLVSDATAASGLGDGEFLLGEVPVVAEGGIVRRGDGTIAGSAAKLLDGVRHLATLGVELGEVLSAASERPAALLGREDLGQIRVGAPACLVVLGDDLGLEDVILDGRSLI